MAGFARNVAVMGYVLDVGGALKRHFWAPQSWIEEIDTQKEETIMRTLDNVMDWVV